MKPDSTKRLGSTMAVIDALPDGAWLIVPFDWLEIAQKMAAQREITIVEDSGGLYGRLGDIPRGAVVGIGQDAFASLHPALRDDVAAVLGGTRFKEVFLA